MMPTKPIKYIVNDIQYSLKDVIWESVLDHVWEQALSSIFRPLDAIVKRRVLDVTWGEVDRRCLRRRSRETR